MNRILPVLFVLIFSAFFANAQSFQVQDLADRLSREADDLAERAYSDHVNRYSNNRRDMENLILAQQVRAAADTFRRLVQDRRRESELRDAASLLVDMSRRFPVSGNVVWRDTGRLIEDLARELRVSGGGSGYEPPPNNGNVVGRVRWRGTVDTEVHLHISEQTLDVRTISGTTYPPGTYNFTSPLQSGRRLNYYVNKLKGRGSVEIIQQPNKENNSTLVVKIRDEGSGAKEYEIEVVWSR